MLSSYQLKTIQIDETSYILSIWDTIGQEKLRSLTKIFFKNSKIVILVYDITNRKSFKELSFCCNSINYSMILKINILLINKKLPH